MQRRSPRPVSDLESQIVDAALRLGGELDGVSMPELARAAGVAVGTLYRIADSKQALARLVARQAQARFEHAVFAPFPARLSLEDRFGLIFDRLVEFALADPDAAGFIARDALPIDGAYVRAAAGFARDGIGAGLFEGWTGTDVVALTWGPVAALLMAGSLDQERAARLRPALWAGLRARKSVG